MTAVTDALGELSNTIVAEETSLSIFKAEEKITAEAQRRGDKKLCVSPSLR